MQMRLFRAWLVDRNTLQAHPRLSPPSASFSTLHASFQPLPESQVVDRIYVQSIPGQSFHVVAEVSEGGASFGRTFKVTVSVDGVSCGMRCCCCEACPGYVVTVELQAPCSSWGTGAGAWWREGSDAISILASSCLAGGSQVPTPCFYNHILKTYSTTIIFVLNICNAYVWSGKTDSIPTHHTLAGTIRVSFTEVRLRAQVPVDDPGRRFAEVLDTKPIAHTGLCVTLGARVPREPSRSSPQPSSLQPQTPDTSAE